MGRKKKSRYTGVDPQYLEKQRESLRRVYRKSVLFNRQELAAIDEYCERYKVESRSALIRKTLMEKVLEGLDKSNPTLF